MQRLMLILSLLRNSPITSNLPMAIDKYVSFINYLLDQTRFDLSTS